MKTANVGQDEGVVDTKDKEAFIACGKETAMGTGPGKVRSNIGITPAYVDRSCTCSTCYQSVVRYAGLLSEKDLCRRGIRILTKRR